MSEMLDRVQARYQIELGNLTDLEVCLQENNRWEAIGVNRGSPIRFSVKTPNGYRCADYSDVQKAISFILKLGCSDSSIRVSLKKKKTDGLKFSDRDLAELNKVKAIDSVFTKNIDTGFEIYIRLADEKKTPVLIHTYVHEYRGASSQYHKREYTIQHMNKVGIDLNLLDWINTMEFNLAEKACAEGSLVDPVIVINNDGKWEPTAKLNGVTMRFFPPNQNRHRVPCAYAGASNALAYMIRLGFRKGEIVIRSDCEKRKPVALLEKDTVVLYSVGCLKEPEIVPLNDGFYQLLSENIDGSETFNLLPWQEASKGCYSIKSKLTLRNLMIRVGFKNIPEVNRDK